MRLFHHSRQMQTPQVTLRGWIFGVNWIVSVGNPSHNAAGEFGRISTHARINRNRNQFVHMHLVSFAVTWRQMGMPESNHSGAPHFTPIAYLLRRFPSLRWANHPAQSSQRTSWRVPPNMRRNPRRSFRPPCKNGQALCWRSSRRFGSVCAPQYGRVCSFSRVTPQCGWEWVGLGTDLPHYGLKMCRCPRRRITPCSLRNLPRPATFVFRQSAGRRVRGQPHTFYREFVQSEASVPLGNGLGIPSRPPNSRHHTVPKANHTS